MNICKILTEFPSEINGVSKTPAETHLLRHQLKLTYLNVNPQAKKLPEIKTRQFHHLVAKLLYLCRCT